jgi:hypothetical protein
MPGKRRNLPGPMIDLATDGVRRVQRRVEVVTAVRRVMLSAYRAGWSWSEVHQLLTDTSRRRLAKQLQTGRGDRPISAGKVNESLIRWWDDITTYADSAPVWDRERALAFIEEVQEALDASVVPDLDRQVLGVVLDLARRHGTTRPAVPARDVAERLGITLYRSHTTLKRLCEVGDWIDLAQRGDQKRANLYRLAPALRAAAPQPSKPEKPEHENGTDMTGATVTITLNDDDRDALLAFLADRKRQTETTPDVGQPAANVVPLAARRSK